jgi:uncharacterized protein YjbJ (UPF0337 family)
MSQCIWRGASGSEAPHEKGCDVKMSKKPINPSRVAIGNAEQATGEALGDSQLVTAGNSNQIKGNLKQDAEGAEDAFEE